VCTSAAGQAAGGGVGAGGGVCASSDTETGVSITYTLRYALFRDFMWQRMTGSYRRFGTPYQSHLPSLSSTRLRGMFGRLQ